MIENLIQDPKKLFAIDGLGAFLTALVLISVLTRFETFFGMPVYILNYLSATALVYSVYSFCCYLFIGIIVRPYLMLIAIANLIYCSFTVTLVFSFYEQLNAPGLFYFLIECFIMIALACLEFKVASSLQK